jgi:hypothetical protein
MELDIRALKLWSRNWIAISWVEVVQNGSTVAKPLTGENRCIDTKRMCFTNRFGRVVATSYVSSARIARGQSIQTFSYIFAAVDGKQ